MVLRPVFIFLQSLLLTAAFTTSAQERAADIELLVWNEFYKLQWEDFQGEPDKTSLGDAGAAVQISAKPFLVKNKVHYDIRAYFNRRKSWFRDTSPSLLAHEQLHFDIAELYARKIRKRVRQLQDQGLRDIKVYNSEIQKLLRESNSLDEQYDLETLHGALSKKQAAWSERVKQELAALKAFKKTRRVIGSRR